MGASPKCLLFGIAVFLLVLSLGKSVEATSSCSEYTRNNWGRNTQKPPNCIGGCNEFPSCAKQCVISGYSNGNCTSMGHDPPCACCCL
ncbi:hypothetical protein DCAR_0626542 [Daucus carota subsp. sativus]|uniref:Knottin scorpion toxin-like domain-containing protein n=1 Tax=Daucus carota subsp. sativus TaxID=79200 RepID=A0AAF0XFG0_DAUCS|nr:hypothetical protein DCAR_0626542 [Daucus carota subsp. sativus]